MATTITAAQLIRGAAADAGLMVKLTGIEAADIDSTNKTIDIDKLASKFPDSAHLRDAYITENGTDFARILKFHDAAAPNKITVDHIPTGLDGSASGNIAYVYFLLTPEDWYNCLNEALEELYKVVRVSVTLRSNQNEYSADEQVDTEGDLCTWLQSRTQIYATEFRQASGHEVSLEQLGGVRYIEDNNSLTVHLTVVPVIDSAGANLVLVARKPYVWRDSMLDSDDDSTNVPYKLGMTALQVKAYRLLFKKHGETMKRQFAAAMVVSEKEHIKNVNEFVPAMRPQPLLVEEAFTPDLPPEMAVWSW